MRVLIVSPYFPFPPTSGIEMRICQLARQIAARHDVTLVSNAEPDDPRPALTSEPMAIRTVTRPAVEGVRKRLNQLRLLASPLPFACHQLHSSEMQRAIDELCAEHAFDLIHVESSSMACFRFPAGVPVVVAEHNLEYELFHRLSRGERSLARRLFYRLEYLRGRRFEQGSWRRARGCVVTSEREEPTVLAAAPATPTTVVPNGVDLDYFAPTDEVVEPHTVVFNGVLNYRPNFDAATYLVDQVWPLVLAACPSARLTFVGHAPPRAAESLARPSVEVMGTVPDIRPYLRRAAVVAVPIRMGGGTRLKVVEAMSLGKAMVSTSVGCEGIAVVDRTHLLIADDPAGFAARILELFEQPELGAELGAASRALAEQRYSWDLAGERLEALYARILGAAAEPAAIGSRA